jgi:hypothetical protein
LEDWKEIKAEYSELIEKEEWEAKFEQAYRKFQSAEWNALSRRTLDCDDDVLAILTMHNEEITGEEKLRRWNSLPSQARRKANRVAKNCRLHEVDWLTETSFRDFQLERWRELCQEFQKVRSALSELPEICKIT